METTVINIHQDVVDGCLAGDRAAQYRFYKLYAKAMLNVCYRILNDEDEAKDALQEVFISAFNNFQHYKGQSTVGSWLKRIAVNKALDMIKKRKGIKVELSENEEDIPDEPSRDEAEVQWEVKKVKEAVRLLPDGFRSVLTMYLIEGYDHKEIAEILNITESTSKSQFNRAKNKLREILKEQEYEKYG